MYPKYGFGRLSERMAEGIARMGNEVRLGAGVTKVHREGNHVTGVTLATDDGEEFFEADNFISSIPLTILAKIIEPAAPPDVLAAADTLVFRNIVTVNILLKRRQVTPDTWLYVHDKNILFGRFHEPKNWSAAMVPSDEFTSLVVEYFCSPGDEIWNMTEEEFVKRTVDHLVDDLGFIDRSEVIDGFIVRAPRAYPSYVIGYEKPLEKIKAFVDELENLQIIGRYGTFRYNNTDHSIETGLLAAKNILGEKHDLDQVNAEKEYHEIKRVPEPVSASR
jgi:protoporphyrinogen oxidase